MKAAHILLAAILGDVLVTPANARRSLAGCAVLSRPTDSIVDAGKGYTNAPAVVIDPP